jgi:hypothetical protein
VPIGDDPQTIARGGPANTGGLGARNGMIVTKGGMVFVAGGAARCAPTTKTTAASSGPGRCRGTRAAFQLAEEAAVRRLPPLPRGCAAAEPPR